MYRCNWLFLAASGHMKEGVALTGGGKLNAKSVIHLSAPDKIPEWKKVTH